MNSESIVPSAAAPASSVVPGDVDLIAAATLGPGAVLIAAATFGPGRAQLSGMPASGPGEVDGFAPLAPGLVDLIAAATSMPSGSAQSSPALAPVGAGRNMEPASSPGAGAGSVALVGTCINDRHPSLAGRVLVRFAAGAGERDLWLATLAHLPVRCEDRVLLLQPGNWPEPLVVGVIDGLRERAAEANAAAVLILKNDETLEIRDQDGAPLLGVVPTPGGPVLRLARADQRLEVGGRLTVAADAIEFTARGEVTLSAGGDVVVNGEEIKLN